MITIDEVEVMLNEIADELPEEFYKKLNGGVIISEETKLHPQSKDPSQLFILGEYHHEPRGLGRYIVIYYGTFVRLYGSSTPAQQKDRLRKLVIHEFTHHLESLAGERGLEIKDAISLAKYNQRFE